MTSFNPTIIKNYPSQGLGGEIMQVMSGLCWRMLIRLGLCEDIKIILTVHDSIYFDFRTEELAKKYIPLLAGMLEGVCEYFNLVYPDVNWSTPFPVDADYGKNIKETNTSVPERDPAWLNIIIKELKDGSWCKFR